MWLGLKCPGTGMQCLCTGLDPADRMSFPARWPLKRPVCAISLMRRLMRNGCRRLAAVIFIPSSVSNGTAALVIPLNSSDCGRRKLQMEKTSQCCRPSPATSSPLHSSAAFILPESPALFLLGIVFFRGQLHFEWLHASHPEAPSLFH